MMARFGRVRGAVLVSLLIAMTCVTGLAVVQAQEGELEGGWGCCRAGCVSCPWGKYDCNPWFDDCAFRPWPGDQYPNCCIWH
jgi:hypothetical protein